MSERLLKGSLAGLRTWLVYATVEFVLACIISPGPAVTLVSWQLPPMLILLGAYLVIGLTLGAAGGLVARYWPSYGQAAERMACLSLLVSFIVNLTVAPARSRSQYAALALAVAMGAALLAPLASSKWAKRTQFLINPWAISLLLLGWPWIFEWPLRGRGEITRFGLSFLWTATICVTAALPRRLRRVNAAPLWRQLTTPVLVVALCITAVLISKPATGGTTSGAIARGKYNIVLITMDTTRADHLSVYGYRRDTTPNLREFAREATIYNRATATADFTLPTHASIFTGVYGGWHGAYVAPPNWPEGRPVDSRYPTVTEVLRAHGYWTAAAVANYSFLDRSKGMAKGFAAYEEKAPLRLSNPDRPFYIREGLEHLIALGMDTDIFYEARLRAADINKQAFALLRTVDRGTNFFLFLNYIDAHQPYTPPAPFKTRFPGRDPRFEWHEYLPLKLAVISGKHRLSSNEKGALLSQYDGGIAYLDSEIGRLLNHLREAGLYENTLIVITADHGEAFGEHNLMEHALGSVYDDQTHVPLLIKYPGQHESRTSNALVSQVDIMPTILDVAGYPAPPGVQGKSLRLPRVDSDVVYSEARSVNASQYNSRLRGVRRAIFSGNLKLESWTDGPPEFYDLASDPGEEHNLYTPGDPRAAALWQRLSSWTAGIPPLPDEAHKPDAADLERLRSLGYAQ
jgi:arylsulfatase A-like enzyme